MVAVIVSTWTQPSELVLPTSPTKVGQPKPSTPRTSAYELKTWLFKCYITIEAAVVINLDYALKNLPSNYIFRNMQH